MPTDETTEQLKARIDEQQRQISELLVEVARMKDYNYILRNILIVIHNLANTTQYASPESVSKV